MDSRIIAKLMGVVNCPKTGKVIHADLEFDESTRRIPHTFPEMGASPTGGRRFRLYVENADSGFGKAKSAGLKGIEERRTSSAKIGREL